MRLSLSNRKIWRRDWSSLSLTESYPVAAAAATARYIAVCLSLSAIVFSFVSCELLSWGGESRPSEYFIPSSGNCGYGQSVVTVHSTSHSTVYTISSPLGPVWYQIKTVWSHWTGDVLQYPGLRDLRREGGRDVVSVCLSVCLCCCVGGRDWTDWGVTEAADSHHRTEGSQADTVRQSSTVDNIWDITFVS